MKKLVIAGLVIAAAVVAAAATLKRQTEEKPSKVSGRHAGDTRTITLPGGATVELCWCPPGSFLMGSPASEEGRFDDETQRPVTLAQGFWLGRYEVTQRQWESVMGTNPSCFRSPDRPVEQVSWEECQAFFRAMRNAVPGLRCRLPTEAEWEYACRAGTKTMRPDEELELAAWYRGNAEGESHPVGGKAANAWGLHDMLGNVCEWCDDGVGTCRVFRGGGWCHFSRLCRSASRLISQPSGRVNYVGFRLCCSVGPRE